jgi:tripeptidyl-peptidase-1
MTQSNAAEFEKRVIEISTPGHATYGQHMKREEVNNFLRPHPFVSDSVLTWLQAVNVSASSIKEGGNWIEFTVPVSQAEQMMKTQFFHFHQHAQKSTAIRTLGYSVPRHIHPYVQLIQPTTRFSNLRSHFIEPKVVSSEDLTAGCRSVTTPACIRDLYGILNTTTRPSRQNILGISGYLEQYARYRDFDHFMAHYAANNTSNFTVVSIHDGHNDQNSSSDSSEASLDMQYAISIADAVRATFYTTAGRAPMIPESGRPDGSQSTNEPYLEQLHYLLSLSDHELPAVLSNSYGEDEQSVPEAYANATCSLFAQLGARGVTVLFSSGDSGPGGSCLSNDGLNRTKFLPEFPTSCPFVTSVGGTHNIDPESAIYFSGGGFSDLFSRPTYQDTAVTGYLSKLGDRWNGLYNPQGRGIPDVATQSSNFVVRDHGNWILVGGTRFGLPNLE